MQIGSCLVEVLFSPLDEIPEAKAMPPGLLIQQLSILLLPLAFLVPQPLDEHNYVNIPYGSNRNLIYLGQCLILVKNMLEESNALISRLRPMIILLYVVIAWFNRKE